MSIIAQLNAVLEELSLLKHEYYQAWSAGHLTQANLKDYASQYYNQVTSFPRFISRVHTQCPEIEARKVLLSNLVDEEIHGTDHPALWMQFAEGMGATREAVLSDHALPETEAMVNTFYELAESDWRDGLCALYAYEYQVPAVSASKIDGLKRFYNINDERTLAFFEVHQVYDVEHSKQVADLIEKYAEPEQALKATKAAAKALLGFLDGMCRTQGVAC